MSRVWTQEQKNAIDARDGTLLVSAAAGSGKTAVLVQRVIERLTDPVHPSDADRLACSNVYKSGSSRDERPYRRKNFRIVGARSYKP